MIAVAVIGCIFAGAANVRSPNPFKQRAASSRAVGVPIKGSCKYLGGAIGPDGIIYCIPANSERVLCIDPSRCAVRYMPSPPLRGKFKWLRGVNIPTDGSIIGLPAGAGSCVKVQPATGEVTVFGDMDSGVGWNWHGGQLCADGFIYAAPANAKRVLKIDPTTLACSLIGPELTGSNKYYGAIMGENGCLYCMPYRAANVLKIDPQQQHVTTLEVPNVAEGFADSWHGGLRCKVNGCIYGIPANANHVLCIDPARGDEVTLLPVPGERDRYQWGGGVEAANGMIYGIPSDARDVLKIDPRTNTVSRFGVVKDWKNKWQNGVLTPDGRIFCLACHVDHILVIDTNTDTLRTIGLDVIGDLGRDKFQGGFLGSDGNIWGIPESCDYVMKIDTATEAVSLFGITEGPTV